MAIRPDIVRDFKVITKAKVGIDQRIVRVHVVSKIKIDTYVSEEEWVKQGSIYM